jgi:hypothetical protein
MELQNKPLTKKQKDFLKVLKAKACNVSAACEAFGIDRQTHYNWFNNSANSTYKKEFESIQESLIDFAESQLLKNIQSGKETSLIFFLKCRAKHRGYLEKEEFKPPDKGLDVRVVFTDSQKTAMKKVEQLALDEETRVVVLD